MSNPMWLGVFSFFLHILLFITETPEVSFGIPHEDNISFGDPLLSPPSEDYSVVRVATKISRKILDFSENSTKTSQKPLGF